MEKYTRRGFLKKAPLAAGVGALFVQNLFAAGKESPANPENAIEFSEKDWSQVEELERQVKEKIDIISKHLIENVGFDTNLNLRRLEFPIINGNMIVCFQYNPETETKTNFHRLTRAVVSRNLSDSSQGILSNNTTRELSPSTGELDCEISHKQYVTRVDSPNIFHNPEDLFFIHHTITEQHYRDKKNESFLGAM